MKLQALTESELHPTVQKKLDKLIRKLKSEYKGSQYQFNSSASAAGSTIAKLQVVVLRLLTGVEGKRELEHLANEIESILQDHVHRSELEYELFAGDHLQAVAASTIKNKGSLSYEDLLSELNYKLTFTI